MQILQLVSEKSWRGGEQQVAYLIEELQKAGVTSHVACRRNTPFEQYCIQQNIPHIALGFRNEFDLQTAFKIKQYCRQQNISLVHVHSGHSHAISVWANLLGNKIPIVLSRRVDNPVKSNRLSHYKYNYPGIARVLCVSDKIKEVVSRSLDNPQICTTVYSGIDLDRFSGCENSRKLHQEFNLPEAQILIGNISAISPHKDYYTFVDTAEQVVQKLPNVTFFIIGDGPERPAIEAYIAQKNLRQHILLTGFRKDIPELMCELDVLLVTSETEGLGTTILDAFAAQTPVVATAAGGIPELVQDGVTGMLAPIKSPGKIAAKIVELIQNPVLRNNIVTGASQKVLKYSKKATALHTLAIYKEILAAS
ncbi:glycosyltransferase family 4 protein [Pontibacter sp. KCTC 32443]|uniref:glycosyltransferase family 4 protein n=1 Tax=Pontibacter TaxID=323449 RepID=UPI00164DB80D|nr:MULTISPECIES: glycosyltransferase family 4 protein [Pontibacter]MBC5774119.1 glycosyltransferase family 4 protein [Pontibacter sp. KCTC 32443]